MGLIVQAQRRAIESLRPHAEPLPPIVDSLELRLQNGRTLYIIGVSLGIGTCSDIRGMDVLVVVENEEPPPMPRLGQERVGGCSYAVLVRDPTEEERLTWPYPEAGCLQCVELLRAVGAENEFLIFSKTGRATVYPSLC